MSNIVQIKRSATTATPPTLADGELAYSSNSSNLFIGKPGNVVARIGGDNTITALTGDITTGVPNGAGSAVATLGTNIVSLENMSTLAANSIIGNNTGSAVTPKALTPSEVRTLLNVADGATANLGTITSVSGTAPVVSSGGTTPTISMAEANATTDGFMTKEYAAKLDGIAEGAGGGTVTSVTAGNGMTQSGTSTIDPTLNIVSHVGTASTIGTINVSADAIGVNLGTTSTTACAGNDSRLSDARTPLAHTVASHSDFPASVSMTELGYLDGVTSAIQTQFTGKISTTYLDTDSTLSANSDTKIATQKATKTYVDGIISAANAMVYKGAIDCSTNPNYPAANAGDTYVISVGGKIGGASGVVVDAGDMLVCKLDGTAAGTQAVVGTSWNIIEKNLVDALTSSSTIDGGSF